MQRILLAMGFLLAFAGAPASAQETDPVAACRTAHGDDAAARIACLEQAITELQAASSEARPDRPIWAIPGFREREERARAEEPASIEINITSVSYNSAGFGRFETDEGQIWVETEAAPFNRRLREGRQYRATISRGLIGGWRMNVDGVVYLYKVEPRH